MASKTIRNEAEAQPGEETEPRRRIAALPVGALRERSDNPNAHTQVSLLQLRKEIEYLGHVPGHIVVRELAAGHFEILSGAHRWAQAIEAGLTHVDCEIVDADDFEAARQVFKSNRRGQENPVLLGRLLDDMRTNRDLSVRELAAELSIGEGTARNWLAYATASALRQESDEDVRHGFTRRLNGCRDRELVSVAELTVHEVRTFLSLPEPLNEMWFRAGGTLYQLDAAFHGQGIEDGGWVQLKVDSSSRREVCARIASTVISATLDQGQWTCSMHRAITLDAWRERMIELAPPETIDPYLEPVASVTRELNLDPTELIDLLPVLVDSQPLRYALAADVWRDILATGATGSPETDPITAMSDLIDAELEHRGVPLNAVLDADDAGRLARAPESLRSSDIPTCVKVHLAWEIQGTDTELEAEAVNFACQVIENHLGNQTPVARRAHSAALKASEIRDLYRRCYTAVAQQRRADSIKNDPRHLINAGTRRLQRLLAKENPTWQATHAEALDETIRLLPLSTGLLIAGLAIQQPEIAIRLWHDIYNAAPSSGGRA